MDQHNNRPIGFFDSGVGGLTVLHKALEILPHEHYLYIGDTRNVPYGIKPPETIKELSRQITGMLLTHNIKALVVACNTVSAIALPEIEKISEGIPVIGVIEPTVTSISLNTLGTIGIIATQATIDSHIYETQLLKVTHGKRKIVSKATSLFVPLIEKNSQNTDRIRSTIQFSLADFKHEAALDTLILGCTHYPLIKEYIADFLGSQVTIVDSSIPTVIALKKILTEKKLLASIPNSKQTAKIWFTASNPTRSIQIAKNLLGDSISIENLCFEE